MSKNLTAQRAAAEKECTTERITLTVAQAAEQLSVSRPTILNWLHKNDGVPHFYAGRKILIPRQALIDWAAQQANARAVL